MKKVLTIAGSDCSGGAGIQADLKTIAAHKMYGMSAITALTAQNTLGVSGIMEVPKAFVEQQIDAIFEDIIPDAVKIGMVANSEIIESIADKLEEYEVTNIVVDPVMVSTSGSKLLNDEAMYALRTRLIPLARVITPNIIEAECLCGFSIRTEEDMVRAAQTIGKKVNVNVLIKGGHLEDSANDLLYCAGDILWYKAKRIENPNTHGTGCTLSSAIACNLAREYEVAVSIQNAKNYITGALKANLDLGKGSGPLYHGYLTP